MVTELDDQRFLLGAKPHIHHGEPLLIRTWYLSSLYFSKSHGSEFH
jgi:hypothetical protein